jgi:hypothetical protein
VVMTDAPDGSRPKPKNRARKSDQNDIQYLR